MIESLQNIVDGIARRWCYFAHPAPMWPVRGTYRCPECHRVYVVPWEQQTIDPRSQPVRTQVPALLEAMDEVRLA
jgi:hypothetical protein